MSGKQPRSKTSLPKTVSKLAKSALRYWIDGYRTLKLPYPLSTKRNDVAEKSVNAARKIDLCSLAYHTPADNSKGIISGLYFFLFTRPYLCQLHLHPMHTSKIGVITQPMVKAESVKVELECALFVENLGTVPPITAPKRIPSLHKILYIRQFVAEITVNDTEEDHYELEDA